MTARPSDQNGMLTLYVALLSVGLLVLCGLVIDGGYVLAGRRRAIDEANGAARAGAEALLPSAYRTSGTVVLDDSQAQAAASDFLAATGHQGTVTVDGDRVSVALQFDQPTTLLGIIGIRSVTVSGRGQARAARGVTAPDTP